MRILFIGCEAADARLTEAREAGYTADPRPGPFDTAAQADLWRGLALAAPDIVWVRWETLGPPDIPSLRRFHVARPPVRIIVEIPDTLEPPNAGIGELVGMGLYDIVRPSQSLPAILGATPVYADVVRWQGDGGLTWDETATSVAQQAPVVEKIVAKRVPLTNRPVLVAVWGSIPGAGASTAALAVACRLAHHGPTACLDHDRADEKGHDSLSYMSGLHYLGQHHIHRLPKRLEIFPTTWPEDARQWSMDGPTPEVPPAPEWPTIFRSRAFAYVVYDAGVYVSGMSRDGGAQSTLWDNADLNVVLLPPALSRLARAHHWIGLVGEGIPGLLVAVLQDGRRDWADAYRQANAGRAPILGLLWPDFTGRDRTWEVSFDALLGPILPDAPAPGGLGRWFGRK